MFRAWGGGGGGGVGGGLVRGGGGGIEPPQIPPRYATGHSHIWSGMSLFKVYLTSVPQPYHWRTLDGLTWKSCLNKSVTLPHPATIKIVKRSCSRYFLYIYRHSPTYAIVRLPTGGSGASRILSKSEVTDTYGKLYGKGFPWNPHTTLEPDRPQHDRPVACVIAQRYSSATLFLIALPFP
jgi:hypothetical protein